MEPWRGARASTGPPYCDPFCNKLERSYRTYCQIPSSFCFFSSFSSTVEAGPKVRKSLRWQSTNGRKFSWIAMYKSVTIGYLANRQEAEHLMMTAAALANDRRYVVLCVFFYCILTSLHSTVWLLRQTGRGAGTPTLSFPRGRVKNYVPPRYVLLFIVHAKRTRRHLGPGRGRVADTVASCCAALSVLLSHDFLCTECSILASFFLQITVTTVFQILICKRDGLHVTESAKAARQRGRARGCWHQAQMCLWVAHDHPLARLTGSRRQAVVGYGGASVGHQGCISCPMFGPLQRLQRPGDNVLG